MTSLRAQAASQQPRITSKKKRRFSRTYLTTTSSLKTKMSFPLLVEDVKQQCIMAGSFVHMEDATASQGKVLFIAVMLNIYGFSSVLDPTSPERSLELASFINLGKDKKLKPIPVTQFEKEELRKKLDPYNLTSHPANQNKNKAPEPNKDQKSEMVIYFVEGRYPQMFDTNMDYFITSLNAPKESLCRLQQDLCYSYFFCLRNIDYHPCRRTD